MRLKPELLLNSPGKIFLIFSLLFLFSHFSVTAQVRIGTTTGVTNGSAMLELESHASGLLLPRLTSQQRDRVPSPAEGLMIFNSTTGQVDFYNGTQWAEILSSSVSAVSGSHKEGNGVMISNIPGFTADSSAILEIFDTIRGLLVPAVDTVSVNNPARGLVVYDISSGCVRIFNGTKWKGFLSCPTASSGTAGVQVSKGMAVREDGSGPDPSAVLDISSASKGLLLPRMTAQERDQIFPVAGLVIYDLSADEMEFFSGSSWLKLNSSLPATVQITADPSDEVCSGQNVTFTATPVNGGTNPQYSWYINGLQVSGVTGNTLVTQVGDGDEVHCQMTPAGYPVGVISNPVIMTVYPTPDTSSILF